MITLKAEMVKDLLPHSTAAVILAWNHLLSMEAEPF